MKKTVLLIDDNATLSFLMSQSIEGDVKDVRVVAASSCREVREVVPAVDPLVAIVDLKLPDGDGLTVIDELSRQFPNMVSIITSAKEPPEHVRDQVFGVLLKPYEPEVLINLVREALYPDHPKRVPRGVPSFPDEEFPILEYDHHRIQNRLAGIVALLKALEADLSAEAENPSSVRRIAAEYVNRLCAITREVSLSLPRPQS